MNGKTLIQSDTKAILPASMFNVKTNYVEVLIVRVSSGQVIQISQLFYVDSFSHIKQHPSILEI